jgi:hypothetical protein
MTQRSNEDLRWYFQDSAAACGQRGQSLEPSTGGGTPNHEPSEQECSAANRMRRIELALAELQPCQVELLRDCYTAPPGTDQGHDAGDGAVLRACADSAEICGLEARVAAAKPTQKQRLRQLLAAARTQLARDTMAKVKAAHRNYVAVRRQHRAAERQLKEEAATAEQRERARERAERLPPRRATSPEKREPPTIRRDRAAIVADHLRALGEHPLEVVRAAREGLLR